MSKDRIYFLFFYFFLYSSSTLTSPLPCPESLTWTSFGHGNRRNEGRVGGSWEQESLAAVGLCEVWREGMESRITGSFLTGAYPLVALVPSVGYGMGIIWECLYLLVIQFSFLFSFPYSFHGAPGFLVALIVFFVIVVTCVPLIFPKYLSHCSNQNLDWKIPSYLTI